jgi:hypothetical protein
MAAEIIPFRPRPNDEPAPPTLAELLREVEGRYAAMQAAPDHAVHANVVALPHCKPHLAAVNGETV